MFVAEVVASSLEADIGLSLLNHKRLNINFYLRFLDISQNCSKFFFKGIRAKLGDIKFLLLWPLS